MKILISNDDGITAKGLEVLAEIAKEYGDVTVVAPKTQCSGMSHRISFMNDLYVRPELSFPVEGVKAYSVTGTPADCVRIAIHCILEEKPDIVFTGINKGYNIGQETLYSGTVGAAIEALSCGVPAIAFSQYDWDDFSVIHQYFDEIYHKLQEFGIAENQIWNVNFPGCTAQEITGIDYDVVPFKDCFYHDSFSMEKYSDMLYCVTASYGRKTEAPKGTDCASLLKNRIAIGKLTSMA